jgi:hypothetical protein
VNDFTRQTLRQRKSLDFIGFLMTINVSRETFARSQALARLGG